MRKFFAGVVASLLMFICLGTSEAATLYFDDFEAYPYGSIIDGQGAWINSGATYQWGVLDNYCDQHYGNFLLRSIRGEGNLSPDPNADYATLHLHNDAGFDGLKVTLNYLLHTNENARIDISPDNSNWNDVTSSFGLTPRASNDVTWAASADLAAQAQSAGLTSDLYLRFSAWNPTSNGEWHWFAIDNLKVEGVPEPSTFVLLGVGAVSFGAYTWRRKRRTA